MVLFGFLEPPSSVVSRWSSPPLPILASQGICMSLPDPDAEVVDLTLTFGGLSVSVRGSPDRAAAFVRDLASQHSADTAAPTRLFQAPASGVSSYTLVSGPPASSFSTISSRRSSSRTSETRSSLRASFSTAPSYLLDLAAELVGSRLSRQERVERAWLAGCWAGAVRPLSWGTGSTWLSSAGTVLGFSTHLGHSIQQWDHCLALTQFATDFPHKLRLDSCLSTRRDDGRSRRHGGRFSCLQALSLPPTAPLGSAGQWLQRESLTSESWAKCLKQARKGWRGF